MISEKTRRFRRAGSPSMTQPAPTILVVDDEQCIAHIVCYKLEKEGYTVISANNGRTAYDLACEHSPDVIITDYQMPGGDGHELAVALSENDATKDIPIIMLTARGHRAPLEELARTGVRSVLAKPFNPRAVLKRVQEILGDGAEPKGAAAA